MSVEKAPMHSVRRGSLIMVLEIRNEREIRVRVG
jgi:hypothetical protein